MRNAIYLLALCLPFAACDDDDDAVAPMSDAAVVDFGVTADDGVEADAEVSEPLDLEAPGPHAVGFRIEEIEYTPIGTEIPRTLRLVMWYPTDGEGTTPRYAGLVARPEVGEGAPVDIDDTAPLLIFSHGSGGVAEQSYFLTEHFASHGWVVAAMDHTGNTFREVVADDGSALAAARLIEYRPQDVSATLDYLEDLPLADALAGKIDDRVAMSGHSFGGYTTLAITGSGFDFDAVRVMCADFDLCDEVDELEARWPEGFFDARVKAGIPLAPAGARIFGVNGLAELEIPTLLVTSGRDMTLPPEDEGDPIWAALTGAERMRLDFPNGGHFSYTDLCFLLGDSGEADGCGDTFTELDEVFRVTRTLTLAFATLHALGDERARAYFEDPETFDLGDDAELTIP